MTIEDLYGVVTRARELRAQYGNRRSHGISRHVARLPDAPKPDMATEARRTGSAKATPSPAAIVCKAQSVVELPKIEPPGPRAITPSQILRVVGEEYAIHRLALAGPARDQPTCRARFAAWRLLRVHLGLSLTQLGRVMGNRDHTSALAGLRRAESLHTADAAWRERYERAETRLCVTAPA